MFWWYTMRLSAGEKRFLMDARVATVKAWLAGNSAIILKQPFASHLLVSRTLMAPSGLFSSSECAWLQSRGPEVS